MIIDGHADISGFLVRQRQRGRDQVLDESIRPDLQAGGITGLINAIYLTPDELPQARASAVRQIEELKRQVGLSQHICLVHSGKELAAAYQRDQIGLFLSLEGAEPIARPSDLDLFFNHGVRFIGLTWNEANQYSGGCHTQDVGLTQAGYELLDRMADKNIILDLSHLSDQAADQALASYRGTVVASHSNARQLSDHVRNLRDDQLEAIARRGGVVGVNGISRFVSQEHAAEEDLRRMIDYLIYRCGEDHVALGFDFCDRYFPALDSQTYDVLAGPEVVSEFLESLRLPGRIKDKLAWQNWLRIFETLDESAA